MRQSVPGIEMVREDSREDDAEKKLKICDVHGATLGGGALHFANRRTGYAVDE